MTRRTGNLQLDATDSHAAEPMAEPAAASARDSISCTPGRPYRSASARKASKRSARSTVAYLPRRWPEPRSSIQRRERLGQNCAFPHVASTCACGAAPTPHTGSPVAAFLAGRSRSPDRKRCLPLLFGHHAGVRPREHKRLVLCVHPTHHVGRGTVSVTHLRDHADSPGSLL